MLVTLVDPSNPTKTSSHSKEDLRAAAAQVSGQIYDSKLDNALEELERSEMVRSSSAPGSGRAAYRLDHDYLTRGVSAVERRANSWHYLLDDRAKEFQNAGTLWKKWKTLLPVGTQCRLAWGRLTGRFHYGNRRNYVLLSLARVPVRMITVGTTFIILSIAIFIPLGLYGQPWMRASVGSFINEVRSTTDSDKIRTETRDFESKIAGVASYVPDEVQSLAATIIEEMERMTNTDQLNALAAAVASIARSLEPDRLETLASDIIKKMQRTSTRHDNDPVEAGGSGTA